MKKFVQILIASIIVTLGGGAFAQSAMVDSKVLRDYLNEYKNAKDTEKKGLLAKIAGILRGYYQSLDPSPTVKNTIDFFRVDPAGNDKSYGNPYFGDILNKYIQSKDAAGQH